MAEYTHDKDAEGPSVEVEIPADVAAFDAPLEGDEAQARKADIPAVADPATALADDEEADPDALSADEMRSFNEEMQKKYTNLSKKKRSSERKLSRTEKQLNEALALVQQYREHVNQTQHIINNGERQYVATAQQTASIAVAQAQAEYRAAYESGDSERVVRAQTTLTNAQMYAAQTQGYQPVAPAFSQRAQQLQNVEIDVTPQLDTSTQQWARQNTWFETNPMMRAYAVQFAANLENNGLRVDTNPNLYFGTVDKEMRLRFPEAFVTAVPAENRQVQHLGASPPQRRTSPVAGVNGGSMAPQSQPSQKVRIPETAVAQARRLGVPIEIYAREYLNRMNRT